MFFLTGLKNILSVIFTVFQNQEETLSSFVSLKWNLSFKRMINEPVDLGNTKQCFIFFLLSMLEYKYEKE